MNYKKINIIFGWLTFSIAAFVYLSTIEPTASFWDCGEFIATSFKLEVGHPPGAPFFMILARFFSLFASDAAHVAKMINSMSALASAFTIMFLFWTITHLAKKIIDKNNELTTGKIIAIIGSGLVGALAYTFSDSFWFSAVEAEVYASSSLFTAVVFWAILKWENVADEKYANRWIILIAYLMGLSLGIHLLNLLAIPAIVFVYYFRKFKPSLKGVISAFLISVLMLAVVMYGILTGILKIASKFELLFVNGFGLPYNTGVIIFALLLIGGIVWGIYYTRKKNKVILNTIIVAFTVILIGYSSYAMVVIRSAADLPLDENNPENVFSLLSYLNREQYGDRPLINGQYYNAPLNNNEPYVEGNPTYVKKNRKYIVSRYEPKKNYDSRFKTLFPRMYSPQQNHIKAYKQWANIKGTAIQITDYQGNPKIINKPTFGENLKFFFRYQLGYMYFRYFMWNFSGRQNNIQSHGGILNGNWISGIKFIDEMRIGNQDNLPKSITSKKSRNIYYMLPFLLGLIGILFQYKKDGKNFWIISLLFFFTGIAIVMYLNQTPLQPRERDYAYTGSFYAFSIWIGLGVLAIYELFNKISPSKTVSAVISSLLCLTFVPSIMAHENWDDHNRSNRYTARDIAYDYLNSCAPNAILFTNGDNDTFPTWYAQEVEGIRTDVRIVCLPYLSTDWYIDQMKRRAYNSAPVPFSMKKEQYIQGKRDYVPVYERINKPVNLKEVINFVASDNPKTKLETQGGENIDYFPARNFIIPVDSAKVIANGTVKPKDADKIVHNIEWKMKANYLGKNDMMILDLLSNNNWDRPIYFVSVGTGNSTNLTDYFQLDGFAYRFVPIKTKFNYKAIGRIDTDILYDKYMNKFKWGGLDNPKVYVDENSKRTAKIVRLRTNFYRLSDALIKENKQDSAIAVLNKGLKILPHECIPFDYFDLPYVEAFYKLSQIDTANALVKKMYHTYSDNLKYFLSLDTKFTSSIEKERSMAFAVLQSLTNLTKKYKQDALSKEISEHLDLVSKGM